MGRVSQVEENEKQLAGFDPSSDLKRRIFYLSPERTEQERDRLRLLVVLERELDESVVTPRTAELPYRPPVHEEEAREAPHAEPAGERPLLVAVDLGHVDLPGVLLVAPLAVVQVLRDVGVGGCEASAVPAPVRL